MFILVVSFYGCSKKSDSTNKTNDIWDIYKQGIPKFVTTNYIELSKIYRISKFRSSEGHDYSDAFEHCRSMKHYFEPRSNVDWSQIQIYSTVRGKITRLDEEWAGTKLEIESTDYPAFRFSISHINLSVKRNVNDIVSLGELLGNHIGSQTMSDIAVMVNDPTRQGRLVSYFEVLTDSLFAEYSDRGVISRDEMIIPKAVRDSNPLSCNSDTFTSADTIENWVILK